MTLRKLLIINFFLILTIISSNKLSSKPAVLIWANNIPLTTGSEFKKTLASTLSNSKMDLADLDSDLFLCLTYKILDQIVLKCFDMNLSIMKKYELYGVALFLEYIINSENDANHLPIFIQFIENLCDEDKAKCVIRGFGYEIMNKKIDEINYLKQWIEINSKKIEEFYIKKRNDLISNNIDIYIPSFEIFKNFIGYIIFKKIHPSIPEVLEICNFLPLSYKNTLDHEIYNYLKVKINYDEWRKIHDEICKQYNLQKTI